MKNIHILPTDKSSRLVQGKNLYFYKDGIEKSFIDEDEKFINIYITSDEEIKEGDWYLYGKEIIQANGLIGFHPKIINACKKIILTDNQDLIKDGVQAIDDEFLEWFVKNPSCENIKVEKEKVILGEVNGTSYIDFIYKIIIPKEEPKQETLEEAAEKYANESFVPMRNSDGEILRIPSGQTVPCGFTKHKKVAIKHFTNGYKLALERSYSKQDLEVAFFEGKFGRYSFNDWFEQFKKK